MDVLKQSLSEYFTSLEKHYLIWQELATEVERPLIALENQTEQLQLVQRIEWETPELPHLKERLIYKITAGIENELFTLREMLCGFISSNKELERRLNKLEQLYHKIECKEHSVMLEMEWAHSSWRYYHTLYIQIEIALAQLDYQHRSSAMQIRRSFQEDLELKLEIQRIFLLFKLNLENVGDCIKI